MLRREVASGWSDGLDWDATNQQFNWVITDYHDSDQWWVYGDDTKDATQWIDFDVQVADREVKIKEGGATKISKTFAEPIPQGAVGLATFGRDAFFDDFSIDEAQYQVSRVFTNAGGSNGGIVCVRDYSSPESYTDSWFHYDFVGSVISISEASGAQSDARCFDAWGNQIDSDSGLWLPQEQGERYSFATKEYDKDICLHFFAARWYEQKNGRFCGRDPMREDVNLYTYAANDPLGFADPDGLTAMKIDSTCNRFNWNYNFPSVETCQNWVETNIDKKNDPKFKGDKDCIKKRCKKSKVRCLCNRESPMGCEGGITLAYAALKFIVPGSSVTMCPENWTADDMMNQSVVLEVLVHEFAHNCGMPSSHADAYWHGRGIPNELGTRQF